MAHQMTSNMIKFPVMCYNNHCSQNSEEGCQLEKYLHFSKLDPTSIYVSFLMLNRMAVTRTASPRIMHEACKKAGKALHSDWNSVEVAIDLGSESN